MLRLSMYGTREAVSAWQTKVREVVKRMGFQVSMTNPCIFKNKELNIECMVHGDDFISIGDKRALKWFKEGLER